VKTIVLSVVTAALCAGCLRAPSASGLRAAAPDPAKYAACERLRAKHNVFTALASSFAASAGVGGLAGDVTSTADKLALGGTGALLGVTGATLGAISSAVADDYSRVGCATVTP
jgi:hypothetical protein